MALRGGKNFNDSLISLTTLLAIFGHAVFQYPSGKGRVTFSVAYTIIVTLIFWYIFASQIDHPFNSSWFATEDKIVYGIVYVNCVIASLTQFFHWYYYKKFQDIVKRISLVDKSLRTLGAKFDYAECARRGMKLIVCWITIVVFENCTDALWFNEKLPIGEIITIICVILYPIHVNTMVSLYYSLMIGQIGERFFKANKLIENVSKAKEERLTKNRKRAVVGKITVVSSKAFDNEAWNNDDDPTRLLQIIRHIHLELTLTAKDFEKIYSVIILLEMADYFVLFTGLFYMLYFMVFVVAPEKRLLRIFVAVAVSLTYIPILILINHMCETTTAEAERTGTLVNRIESMNEDADLNDEIKQFNLQLMANRLSFSPLGFFTLGYNFLRGFLGTVVTYLVILIQMGSDPEFHLQ